jgi:hypothetical protein
MLSIGLYATISPAFECPSFECRAAAARSGVASCSRGRCDLRRLNPKVDVGAFIIRTPKA